MKDNPTNVISIASSKKLIISLQFKICTHAEDYGNIRGMSLDKGNSQHNVTPKYKYNSAGFIQTVEVNP